MSSIYWVGGTTAWGTGANWSGAAAPVDADSATFDQNGTTAVAGSDQSAIELAALYVLSTYIYDFGTNGTPMKVDATLVEIGRASKSSTAGAHSGRINLWTPDLASTFLIFGTKTSSTDSGKEPVRIKSAATSGNKLIMSGAGRVGVATDSIGDTAQFDEIACLSSGAIINVGSGTTLTKWRQELGTGNLYGALTTIQQDGGVLYTYGSGAITTANISGTAYLGSSGTITTLNVLPGGRANGLQDSRAKTVATINLYKGATLDFDPAIWTVTNPINLVQCDLEDVTINVPKGLTVAVVKT